MRVPKVPAHIKHKMHRLAKLTNQAAALDREISDFFEEKGFNIDALRCGNGASLDELAYGNDVTDELCQRIESGEFDDATSPFHVSI